MAKPVKLPWGKSPFDDMPHDELLYWARRMYAVCTAARSVMALARGPEPWSLFWRKGGSGAEAMSKADLVVVEIERRFDSESIYRSFYRYAVDLLFSPEHGHGWHVCTVDGCGQMIGRRVDDAERVPECPTHRGQTMRPIAWSDLVKS